MVLQAQEAGDPDVREVMDRAVGYLGLALAGVVNLISPGAGAGRRLPLPPPRNRETLLREAQRHFYGLNAQEVAIRFLPFDHYGGARGAAAAVIERFCIQGDDLNKWQGRRNVFFDHVLSAAHASLSVAKLWSASEVREVGAWERALPSPLPQTL